MKIAIIGSGISGITLGHHLCKNHEITVFEALSHIGGHTHTHAIELEGKTIKLQIVSSNCNFKFFVVVKEITYLIFLYFN